MQGTGKRAPRVRARARALTHVDERGQARMVDVGDKASTVREAVARGEVRMRPETLRAIVTGGTKKGDVLAVARIAGILAAKRTHELVPLCHPLSIEAIAVELTPDARRSAVDIEARVRVSGKTGVEMEALTAVAVAGLAIYDMVKSIDRGMRIERVRLVRKSGGKSGDYVGR